MANRKQKIAISQEQVDEALDATQHVLEYIEQFDQPQAILIMALATYMVELDGIKIRTTIDDLRQQGLLPTREQILQERDKDQNRI